MFWARWPLRIFFVFAVALPDLAVSLVSAFLPPAEALPPNDIYPLVDRLSPFGGWHALVRVRKTAGDNGCFHLCDRSRLAFCLHYFLALRVLPVAPIGKPR